MREESTSASPRVLLLLGVWLLVPHGAAAASPQDWYTAREIHYRIEGLFEGAVPLTASGEAQIKDRVELDLTTDTGGLLKGEISITNFPTEVLELRAKPAGCHKPELSGPFEYYTLQSIEPLPGGALLAATAHSTTDYPDMVVGTVCDGALPVAAKQEPALKPFRVPMTGEYLLDPQLINSDKLQLDPASSTIVMKELGWTWTFRATPRK